VYCRLRFLYCLHMSVLDCESVETTYHCLEYALGMGRDDIESAFAGLDIDRFYEENSQCVTDPVHLVFSVVTGGLPPFRAFDTTCWFHLTRATKENTFEQGILPLGEALDSIWDSLYELVRRRISVSEWRYFRRNLGDSDSAHLYRTKVENPEHWGPYAVLIRDGAFRPDEMGNHDYLRVPEIIEDICMCFASAHGFDLLEAYRKSTKPCIVKFVDDETRQDCTRTALFYLYTVYSQRELSHLSNNCFDSRGKSIPKEHILSVEYPDYC
jgi:hypothetical protein